MQPPPPPVPVPPQSGPPGPGSSQRLANLLPSERIAIAEHLCLVLQAGRSFMRDLGRTHERDVIFSHGDHVPLQVRNAAVVAFWLPDFLGVDTHSMQSREAREFWSSRVSEFCVAAEYVAKHLVAYRWPSEYELRAQYRDLMQHWAKLFERRDVRELVLPGPAPPQAHQKPKRKHAAAGRSLQLTSGEKEHGSALVALWPTETGAGSSSLQASQQPATCSGKAEEHFQWELWWQAVHTGCLPNGTVINFVPQEYAAAFAVFHFTGMFGTSEADAESTGGTLKRFAKSLSTQRVVESTILRSAGLGGCGGGGEDGFLELCWADFFGDRHKFSFHYKNSKKRRRRFAEGRGSATLERLLTKNNPHGNKWTEHDLLKNAQSMGAGTGPKKTFLWAKVLKEGRIFETGAG